MRTVIQSTLRDCQASRASEHYTELNRCTCAHAYRLHVQYCDLSRANMASRSRTSIRNNTKVRLFLAIHFSD